MAATLDQPALFTRLPNEVIAEIFQQCHVSDHFNLALTCRRLANGGHATLERHRAAYREYGVVTDWKALTIPSILQKVISDPYVAWNIRTIEIFGTRYGWENWGDFVSEPPSTVEVSPTPWLGELASESFEGGDTYHAFRWFQAFEKPPSAEFDGYGLLADEDWSEDYAYPEWRTIREEKYRQSVIEKHLSTYISLLIEYGHICNNDFEIERATEHLSEGNDSLLKALLISLCPRLNVLRHASGKDDTRDLSKLEGLDCLSRLITRSWRSNSWAPGLKRLREVSVGVPTGLWFEDRNLSGLHKQLQYRSVMLLPGLKSVYFGTMDIRRDTHDSWDDFVSPPAEDLMGCSSVENIFIDQFVDVYDEPDQEYTVESVIEFLLIPKKLKSLTVRGGLKRQLFNKLGDQALYIFMILLSKNLENVIEYNCRLRPADSTWGWFGRTDVVRRLYKKPTIMMINAVDLLSSTYPRLTLRKDERDNPEDPRLAQLIRGRHCISLKAEVVLIQKSYRDDGLMDEEVKRLLELQVYSLVRNKWRNGGKLKAIYIQQQPNPNDGNKIAEFDFSRAIELSKKMEIDIHVKENKAVPFHQIDFPVAPTMSTIPGQEMANGGGERVFDPFTGYWTTV
ncbi:hypothetical protein FLONG3_6313 [Fusarium longipes]|uniref:F-box domain-containing protein n=1 Tax=Fusarium longipes TaxID=694270 RepID=A0A395SMG7_9HYPO|nr:hypothetical protein FLONG3_6313 [Fusarium longipes]